MSTTQKDLNCPKCKRTTTPSAHLATHIFKELINKEKGSSPTFTHLKDIFDTSVKTAEYVEQTLTDKGWLKDSPDADPQ
jgi:hypothetical protein